MQTLSHATFDAHAGPAVVGNGPYAPDMSPVANLENHVFDSFFPVILRRQGPSEGLGVSPVLPRLSILQGLSGT